MHVGFNLWTSAHGFHHLELTRSSTWKAFWTIVLIICSIALIACIIYYFYYVFALGVYSRFLLETPSSMPWPTTVVCDRQVSALKPSWSNSVDKVLKMTFTDEEDIVLVLPKTQNYLAKHPSFQNKSKILRLCLFVIIHL